MSIYLHKLEISHIFLSEVCSSAVRLAMEYDEEVRCEKF